LSRTGVDSKCGKHEWPPVGGQEGVGRRTGILGTLEGLIFWRGGLGWLQAREGEAAW